MVAKGRLFTLESFAQRVRNRHLHRLKVSGCHTVGRLRGTVDNRASHHCAVCIIELCPVTSGADIDETYCVRVHLRKGRVRIVHRNERVVFSNGRYERVAQAFRQFFETLLPRRFDRGVGSLRPLLLVDPLEEGLTDRRWGGFPTGETRHRGARRQRWAEKRLSRNGAYTKRRSGWQAG